MSAESAPIPHSADPLAAPARPPEGSPFPHAHRSASAGAVTDVMLFYDGTCGFCAKSVQFILNHEGPRHWLYFATLQGPLAQGLREKYPQLADVDSVVWYEPATAQRKERLLVRSAAGLRAAAYLGGIWRVLAWFAWWVPRPIRDAVYNLVARNRHRLVRNDTCMLPTPEQRARFIE